MILLPSQSKVASKISKLPATQPLWLDDITKAHFPQESGKPSGEDGVRLGGQTWVANIHDRLATPNGGWL